MFRGKRSDARRRDSGLLRVVPRPSGSGAPTRDRQTLTRHGSEPGERHPFLPTQVGGAVAEEHGDRREEDARGGKERSDLERRGGAGGGA